VVDNEIFKFEESKTIKRDGKTATTFEELNNELDKLEFPESIKNSLFIHEMAYFYYSR
jgi:hypothetical protein